MFLSISKNACTSLKALLYRLEHGQDFPEDSGVHHYFGFSERTGQGRIVDRRSRESLARYSQYLKFVVHRDPVDRFLSLYHNKVLWPPSPHPFYTKYRLEGLALDPFLDIVEEILTIPDPLQIDEHIRPQARYYTKHDVDFIVAIKALPRFLAEKFDITEFPRQNEHGGIRLTPTDQQKERIRNLYREDYEIVPNYGEK